MVTLRCRDARIWSIRLTSLKSIVSLLACDFEVELSSSSSTTPDMKKLLEERGVKQ